MKVLLTAINAKYIHSNLAVYSLKAYANEYAQQIEIMEFTINQQSDTILEQIYKMKPDVLCFSCYIWNVSYVRDIAKEFHNLCPDTPIWVGGPEVTYESEQVLKDNPAFTGVIAGEGEIVFKNLCEFYVKKSIKLENISGIIWRKNDRIIINPLEVIMSMDTIPFPYEQIDDFKNKIIYYESSRGCPFSCSYCLSSVEKHVRFRSVELVKQELGFFLEKRVPQVKFVDRTFNCDKNHAMEIWSYIQSHDNGYTNFHFEIAADLLTDEEIEFLSHMRKGLIQLEIGVQSTNFDTIVEIHRQMDLTRVKEVVNKIKQYQNIHQHLDLIAGLPFEDYHTFSKSFDEVYQLKPEQLQLGFLKVLKGSYMYQHAQEYEAVYSANPPYEVRKTKWLSYDEVLKIKQVEEMVEVYYNSGQFPMTIRLLEGLFSSGFDMFQKIGIFYEENGYFDLKHSRNRRAEIILEFIAKYNIEVVEVFSEAAVFDIYSRENAKSRPSFAKDWSNAKKMSRLHCNKGKLSHLEEFIYPLPFEEKEIDIKLIQKGMPYYVLFDYEDISPMNQQATFNLIEEV